MGELVLFQDEVNPVMSATLEAGLEVTALHDRFFFDDPRVYFMHIGGEGTVAGLAAGVKSALDAQRVVRQQTPQPADRYGAPPIATPSQIDNSMLDSLFGLKGIANSGMYKVIWPRTVSTSCCSLGGAMGIKTWAAFAGTNSDAAVAGDFAVSEFELQRVLKSLRSSGINIVSIHHQTTLGEAPRMLFLHYWGRGALPDLAINLLKAVDLTAWDGQKSPRAGPFSASGERLAKPSGAARSP